MFWLQPAAHNEKISARSQKHTHIQKPAQHNYHTAQPADFFAVNLIKKLRYRNYPRVPQRLEAKTRQTDNYHRRHFEDADNHSRQIRKSYPFCAVYMQVTIPNSVAASDAMPK